MKPGVVKRTLRAIFGEQRQRSAPQPPNTVTRRERPAVDRQRLEDIRENAERRNQR